MPPPRRLFHKLRRSVRRWHIGRRARLIFAAAPVPARVIVVAAAVLAGLFLVNIVYQVIRKPTELLFFIGHRLDKAPSTLR